jgi:hypothetical protein
VFRKAITPLLCVECGNVAGKKHQQHNGFVSSALPVCSRYTGWLPQVIEQNLLRHPQLHFSPLQVHLRHLQLYFFLLQVHLRHLQVYFFRLQVHLRRLQLYFSLLQLYFSLLQVHLDLLQVHLCLLQLHLCLL